MVVCENVLDSEGCSRLHSVRAEPVALLYRQAVAHRDNSTSTITHYPWVNVIIFSNIFHLCAYISLLRSPNKKCVHFSSQDFFETQSVANEIFHYGFQNADFKTENKVFLFCGDTLLLFFFCSICCPPKCPGLYSMSQWSWPTHFGHSKLSVHIFLEGGAICITLLINVLFLGFRDPGGRHAYLDLSWSLCPASKKKPLFRDCALLRGKVSKNSSCGADLDLRAVRTTPGDQKRAVLSTSHIFYHIIQLNLVGRVNPLSTEGQWRDGQP